MTPDTKAPDPTAEDVLVKISRPIDVAETQDFVQRHYGLAGSFTPIAGERDHNFVLSANGGNRYIVKVAHEDEDYGVLDFQSCAIARIAAVAPQLPLSHDLRNRDGTTITTVTFGNGDKRFLRLNQFMPGQLLYTVPQTQHTRTALAELTATLALAFTDFTHPAEQRKLLWDIQQAPDLSQHIATLPAEHGDVVRNIYDTYMQDIAPNLHLFRSQIIHNDLNPHNIFVSADDHATIAGCIDFGDIVRAPIVNDLAIAASYQLDSTGDVVGSIIAMAKAYHSIHPLVALEIDHLCTLVAMRCVLTVAITHWRARLHPENAPYILRNVPLALAGLNALSQIPTQQRRQRLHDELRLD